MSRTRKILLWTAGGLLGALLLVFAAGLFLLRSDGGRDWLAGQIETAASAPGGLTLSLGSLEGSLPAEILLNEVTLSDPEGDWLTLDRARLAWNPLALISGRLDVEELIAGELTVIRAPALPADEPPDEEPPDSGDPLALPELPVEVSVQKLRVERLSLGESLIGTPAVLRVDGEAGARRAEGLTTRLAVERLDGAAGRVDLDAGIDPTGKILRIDLVASEPPGGVMARLLDLPDLPAIETRLQGEGPLSDWRGALTGKLDGLAEWQADLGLALEDETKSVALEGKAALSLDPAIELAPLVNGEHSYRLAARLLGDNDLEIETLTLNAPTLDLDAGGALTLDPLEGSLRAALDVRRPEALPGWPADFTVAGLRVEAQAEGLLDRPKSQVMLSAGTFAGAGARLDGLALNVTAEPTAALTDPAARVDFKGELSLADFAVDGLEDLEALLGPGLSGSFSGAFDLGANAVDVERFDLESGQASVGAEGRIDLAGPTASLGLDVVVAELAPLEALVGLPLAGRAALRADLEDASPDAALTVPFELSFTALSTGIPQADLALGPEPAFAGSLQLSPEGQVGLSEGQLQGRSFVLALDAELDPGADSLQARYDLAVPDLAPLSEAAGTPLAGSLSLDGEATGSPANPAVTLQAEAEALSAAGMDLGQLLLTLSAENLVAAPAGDIGLRLDAPAGPLSLDSGFRLEGERLSLSEIALASQGTEVLGDLALDLDSQIAEGTLQGRSADFSPWFDLAGLDGGGRGVFAATLGGRAGKQAAALRAELANLALALGEGSPLTLDSLTAELRSADIASLAGEGSARASGLTLDALELEDVTLAASGGAETLGWDLTLRGRYQDPLSLNGTGRVALRDDGIAASIDSLEGGAMGFPLILRAPVTLTQKGARLAVSDLDLEVAGGRLAGDASLDGPALDARLGVTDFPLASTRRLAGLPGLDGTLGASIVLTGRAPTPEGRLELTVADLVTQEDSEAPPLQIEIGGDWRNGRFAVDGEVAGFAEAPATLSLALPVQLDPNSLSPILADNAPLEGTLEWAGPIDQVWPLVPVGDQILGGEAALSATLAGTLSAPVASGGLTVTEGRYENLSTGTLLTELALRVVLEGRSVAIESLTASDGSGGQLSAQGSAELLPEEDFPFDFSARFEDLTVTRRDEVTAAIDGTLEVSGTAADSNVVGRFETRGVEVRIPNRLPPEVVELEVSEINRPGAEQADEAAQVGKEEAAGPVSVALDIAVSLPGKVFVRGRGLESEWRGEIAVTGTAARPEIAGQLSVVRGQLSVLGREFNLAKGVISFPGGAEIDPLLDIVAENEGDDVTVVVSVFGTPARPEITFSSRPELPQDEILARVLFDKNTTQLTPFEALQLAGAAAELSGRGSGGGGVLDFARNLVGVDVLRFESGEDSDLPGLSAGKYVTDDVYVGVKQGATAGSGSVGVEVELTPNISVESGVDQRGSSELGVKFKWDY